MSRSEELYADHLRFVERLEESLTLRADGDLIALMGAWELIQSKIEAGMDYLQQQITAGT